jgi:hypothetical protein
MDYGATHSLRRSSGNYAENMWPAVQCPRHDWGDLLGLEQMLWPDVGDPQVADQPGGTQLGQRTEVLCDQVESAATARTWAWM